MPSSAVTKQPPAEVAQPVQQQGDIVQTKEQSTSASASAGLNLNLFAAVSGAFSGKSKKETAADGSSVENKSDKSHIKGAGAGNLSAVAAAQGDQRARHYKQQPVDAIEDGEA